MAIGKWHREPLGKAAVSRCRGDETANGSPACNEAQAGAWRRPTPAAAARPRESGAINIRKIDGRRGDDMS